jgi:hypothetical protein
VFCCNISIGCNIGFHVQIKDEVIPFITLSDDKRKTAVAVWAHLKPILHLLGKEFPEVRRVSLAYYSYIYIYNICIYW